MTSAATTAIASLSFFDDVAERIEPIAEISREEVPEPEPGEPYTILLLGSDRRPNLPDQRSDTTMLLRLDPDLGIVSLLSIPRDLEVSVPGVGYERINAAYTVGGPRLVLKTVQLLTGLDVNEVVDVDFNGFADAVNAVGCVYVDVDRKYLNPPQTGYAEIDINAGYQRLCGLKALQYVRFRHTDNDIVRAARQQAFLREARQRFGVGRIVLGGEGSELIDAFTENTRSTIDSGAGLRRIAQSIFELRDASLDQIRISGDLGPEEIRASEREIRRAVDRFLEGSATRADEDPAGGDAGRENSGADGDGGGGRDPDRGGPALVAADPQFGRYAATANRRLGFPAFYPSEVAVGTAFSRDSRTYEIEDPEGERHGAYRLVLTHPHPQITTEYYGLNGTSWKDAPILRNPSDVREIGGRNYLLFYAGGSLQQVGWREGGNAYWLSNSLLGSLTEREMLGIASSIAAA